MPRLMRPNPRRHIDQLAAETARVLAERRDAVLPNEHDLNVAAVVKPADVDAATTLWDEAQRQAGTGLEGLLDAKGSRRDG